MIKEKKKIDQNISKDDRLAAIDSIWHLMWQLLWRKYLWLTIVLIAFVLLAVYFSPPVIPVVIVFYLAFVFIRARELFFQYFAENKGFQYNRSLSVNEVRGKLFSLGHSRKIRHVVSGKYNDYRIRFFHYQYMTGGGKHQRAHRFTVFEVFFEKINFPHIILQPRSMWMYYLALKGDKRISLEPEFQKSFRLFSKDGYQIETLQIFKPEILRFLKEKSSNFAIEMINDRLYIYDDISVFNKKQLLEMLAVFYKIIDVVSPVSLRLGRDFQVLHDYYRK